MTTSPVKASASAEQKAFVQGYVAAAANLINLHGETTMARDLLDQIGRVDWRSIDEYDRNVIKAAKLKLSRWSKP